MTESSTITIRLSTDTKNKLGRLAEDTRRSKSFLAAEAISRFVERELDIIDGIHQALSDVQANRVVTQEEAVEEIFAAINETIQTRQS